MNSKDAFREIMLRIGNNKKYIGFLFAILFLNIVLLSLGIPVAADPRIGPTPGVPPP